MSCRALRSNTFIASTSLGPSMNSLLDLVSFKSERSHSVLVDSQQKHLRNAILFGTGLCAIRLLFGVVISCQGSAPASINDEFLNIKCYINGTETDLYHDYYQFTSVFLVLLALAVPLPFRIWSHFAGREVRELEHLANQPELAIQALYDSRNLFMKTVALEGCYLLYWIGLLFGTNAFFNGYWSRFRWSWHAIPKLFPDMGTCYFSYYQEGGNSTAAYNCLLPLSSVYRRVFWALYWIVAFLLPSHLVVLTYRAITWIRYPRKELERAWALQIVLESTESWSVRKKLNLAMKGHSNDIV